MQTIHQQLVCWAVNPKPISWVEIVYMHVNDYKVKNNDALEHPWEARKIT